MLFAIALAAWLSHVCLAMEARYVGANSYPHLAASVFPRRMGGRWFGEVLVDLWCLVASGGRAIVVLGLSTQLVRPVIASAADCADRRGRPLLPARIARYPIGPAYHRLPVHRLPATQSLLAAQADPRALSIPRSRRLADLFDRSVPRCARRPRHPGPCPRLGQGRPGAAVALPGRRQPRPSRSRARGHGRERVGRYRHPHILLLGPAIVVQSAGLAAADGVGARAVGDGRGRAGQGGQAVWLGGGRVSWHARCGAREHGVGSHGLSVRPGRRQARSVRTPPPR